ncbi:MAG: acyl-CoA thioesterase [Rubrivivax sp.]|jgi:4-hydroxybenzoyl-CoA thioesterase|nr:acyl-CoA thioesterase [Rubrivivax sp.]
MTVVAPALHRGAHFETRRTVRFADCDPAGIVFFPQYLVMLNTLVEEWFDRGLGIAYAGLIGVRRCGLPTVRLEVDFTAVSRHGDELTQRIAAEAVGRSSLTLRAEFLGSDGLRLRARQVLVCTSLESHRPQPLPDDVRRALAGFVAGVPKEAQA